MGKSLAVKLAPFVLAGMSLLSGGCSKRVYTIDNSEVKCGYSGFDDLIEKKEGYKIRYVLNGELDLKKVIINGNYFNYHDSLVYPSAKERWKYLHNKIDSINIAKIDPNSKKELRKQARRIKHQIKINNALKALE